LREKDLTRKNDRGDCIRELEQILGINYWMDFEDHPIDTKRELCRLLEQAASRVA
tara:strand:- start:239 stop:403 length:165 start_codon:yes stop_codon:yes gene_type:complete